MGEPQRRITNRARRPAPPPPHSHAQVHSWGDLRHCMQQLCGLSSDKLMAVELLWTPQDEGDFLTREQVRGPWRGEGVGQAGGGARMRGTS